MCGILGYYNRNYSKESFLQATESIAHRGPDNTEIYQNDKVGLGHQRLSILDLTTAANQPIFSHCNRYIMVYNGEVYNFKELASRHQLHLKTNSDTEVILQAFVKLGNVFVNELNGMFAIAIYDTQNNELHLFRDRIGIKPLYLYRNEQTFAFSSEIKALVSLINKDNLSINKNACGEFLHYGYIPGNKTIYNEIEAIPAGNYVKISGQQLLLEPYWSIENNIQSETIVNEIEAKDTLDKLLNKSVSERLISDVPLGTFLSGGVDSSLVTALAAQNSNSSINTFSIGFKEAKHNESEYARKVSKHLNTNHHEFILTEDDALHELEKVMDQYDQPFSDSSALPTYLVSKMAKKHVSVCLSGDGGDELFMGYGAYNWRKRFSNPILWHLRKPISKLLSTSSDHRKLRAANMFDAPTNNLASHIFSQEQYLFSREETNTLLKNNINYHALDEFKTKRQLSVVEKQSLFDLRNYLKDDLLVKVDIASMANSLEVRVPILSHEVIEYAINIDESLKLKNNNSQKYILKEVLYNYVPKELFDRPKWGFSIPLSNWLQKELSYLIERYLNEETVNAVGLYNTAIVMDYVSRFNNGETYLYNRLWVMLLLNKFLLER